MVFQQKRAKKSEHAIKPMVFQHFCVFCILAQGFSQKMRLFERKHNKTNAFSLFLSEKTIKPMDF